MIFVPLAELILSLLGSLRLDLGYSDTFIPTVPRFVVMIVFAGNVAIFSS